MFRLLSTFLLTCLTTTSVYAEMVSIPATRDATLIEDSEGMLANGSGPALFAGRTGQEVGGIRRALIRFDVAAELPENALIDRVSLSLYLNKGNPEPTSISLHRVLSDWGEGASSSNGGGGAPAQDHDATWLHTFYDYDYWVQAGGHFIPHASSTQIVDETGPYTWSSTVSLANNVRLWLHAPQQNFGWLVLGDEDLPRTVMRFDSRDGSTPPMLTVEYHLPGE